MDIRILAVLVLIALAFIATSVALFFHGSRMDTLSRRLDIHWDEIKEMRRLVGREK